MADEGGAAGAVMDAIDTPILGNMPGTMPRRGSWLWFGLAFAASCGVAVVAVRRYR